MKKSSGDIPISLFSGSMDLRSANGAVGPNARVILNLDGSEAPHYRRMGGWRRYLAESACYSNHDLHDQLWGAEGGTDSPSSGTCITPFQAESVSLLFSFISSSSRRRLIAGTRTKLLVNDDTGGNWRVLADGLGGACIDPGTYSCHPTRFVCDKFGDIILFTNNVDPVLYWRFDAPSVVANALSATVVTGGTGWTTGDIATVVGDTGVAATFVVTAGGGVVSSLTLNDGGEISVVGANPHSTTGSGGGSSLTINVVYNDDSPKSWSAQYVQDLVTLNITAAAVIVAYGGFMLIGNVIADATPTPSRLYWSDLDNPTSWFPGTNSAAGYYDFGNGETIIAARPLGGRLRVYTDQAIYDGVTTTAGPVFVFTELYRGKATPKFPHGFVDTGKAHFFMTEDSIYSMNPYDRSPNRLPWLYLASGAIYKGLDATLLNSAPSGVNPFGAINKSQCLFPCGGYDENKLAIWFSWPSGSNTCNDTTLILWPEYSKAAILDHGFTAFTSHRPDFRLNLRDFLGMFNICDPSALINVKEEATCQGSITPTAYDYLYNSTEDASMDMDPDSAIAAMCGYCLDDLCSTCDSNFRFLMASAQDKTIKQFEPDMQIREMFTGVTPQAYPISDIGCYTDFGYVSFMQGDYSQFGLRQEKLVQSANLSVTAPVQDPPGNLYFQVGSSNQPNQMDWWDDDPWPLEGLDGGAASGSVRAGQFPAYRFHVVGAWISWRFWVTGVGQDFSVSNLFLTPTQSNAQY